MTSASNTAPPPAARAAGPSEHDKRRRILRAAIYAGVMAVFAAIMLSGYVRCPVASLTHQPCPGCGSTRAVRAMLSLDFAAALRFNPAAPIVTACIGVIALEGLWLVVRDGNAGQLAAKFPGKWAVRVLVVAVAAEFVVWGLRFFGLFGGPVPV